jgi:hypothetical protein
MLRQQPLLRAQSEVSNLTLPQYMRTAEWTGAYVAVVEKE